MLFIPAVLSVLFIFKMKKNQELNVYLILADLNIRRTINYPNF